MSLRVKEIAKAHGISITELAERMGIRQESLSRAINGNPTLSTLESMADALNVSVSELFESRGDFVAFVRKDGAVNHFDKFDELAAWVEDEKGGTQ